MRRAVRRNNTAQVVSVAWWIHKRDSAQCGERGASCNGRGQDQHLGEMPIQTFQVSA